MAQPSTGVSFAASGLAYLNSLRVRRGGRWSIAVRDYGGSATNLLPGSSFGPHGHRRPVWRADLFAIVRTDPASGSTTPLQPRLLPAGLRVGRRHRGATRKVSNDPAGGLQAWTRSRGHAEARQGTVVHPLERNVVVDAIRF